MADIEGKQIPQGQNIMCKTHHGQETLRAKNEQ